MHYQQVVKSLTELIVNCFLTQSHYLTFVIPKWYCS